jgi:type VI secretion system protein ImpK
LVLFHNETWGGEKVFQLLTRLIQSPTEHQNLLELIYACLALGFEGRYKVMQNGASELGVLRERLGQLLRRQRGEFDRQLSLSWAPASVSKSKWLGAVPVWVFAAIVLGLMLLAYMAYSFLLTRQSDPLFGAITSIRANGPTLAPPKASAKPRLAQFLAPEIQQGLVEVRDFEDRSIVTVRGDGLFEAGSAGLKAEREPLMLRIADALASLPGLVLITGHTDSQPITSARFPSNWHLSQERAKTVAGVLAKKVPQSQRLQAEGRADTEPLAPNDSSDGRSRNRRVEVTLFVTKQG